jgi:hypothetical protein
MPSSPRLFEASELVISIMCSANALYSVEWWDGLEMMWKEAVVVYVRVLSQNSPGKSDERHRKPRSG